MHSTPISSHQPSAAAGKRKFLGDEAAAAAVLAKKRRSNGPQQQPQKPSTPTISPYVQVYSPLLEKISPNYAVKTMTVLPSTSIAKHVDRALSHLGRFSAWDQKVLPGVVLLCAKSTTSNKLITIAELVRRRIGESEQKWFQYNVLSDDTVCEEQLDSAAAKRIDEDEEMPSVVEDTYMDLDGAEQEKQQTQDAEEEEGEYFETSRLPKSIHEQAVEGPTKVRYRAHMTVLLSRVPLEELKTARCVMLQTNQHHIEHLRKKNQGLVN